jgi:hypothetical protein
LLRLLKDTEAFNGFANRFLWICVRRAQLLPDGGCTLDGCIPKKWSCCSHLKFLHVLQLRCWRANLQLRFQLC